MNSIAERVEQFRAAGVNTPDSQVSQIERIETDACGCILTALVGPALSRRFRHIPFLSTVMTMKKLMLDSEFRMNPVVCGDPDSQELRKAGWRSRLRLQHIPFKTLRFNKEIASALGSRRSAAISAAASKRDCCLR